MDRDVSGQCWRSLLRSHHRLLQKVVALGEQATVLGEIRSCYCSIINVQRMQIIRIYGWWMGGFKGLDCAISLKVEWFLARTKQRCSTAVMVLREANGSAQSGHQIVIWRRL